MHEGHLSVLLFMCLCAGSVGALLQGMLGIGTGLIIVPLLTFVLPHYGIPTTLAIHIAVATSMAAIATNALSALRSHYYRGNIHWVLCKKIIFFSMLGAGMGAYVIGYMPARYLQILFAGILVIIAIYMFWNQSARDQDTDVILTTRYLAWGGFGVGCVASIVGSGGGVVMVPFLHALKLKMRYAVGTSTLIGLPIALTGTAVYIWVGLPFTAALPWTIGYLHWPAFLAITCAGMLSGPLGVKLSSRVNARVLRYLFAVLIIVIGVKMLVI